MAVERAFPAVPQIIGGGRIIPSPAQFYLTGEDRLRVVAANTLVGCVLKIQARLADNAGVIVPQSWTHTPTTDRTVTSSDFSLGTGSLLNVTVFAGTGTPRIGQTFVIVQLVRGFGAAAIVLGTLVSGYVTSRQAIGFPGSPLQNSFEAGGYYRGITGTVPAVGAQFSETVPTGARWQLLAVETQFVANATVATRVLSLQWQVGALQVGVSGAVATVTAGLTGTFNWMKNMPLAVAVQAGINVQGLPDDMMLLAGDTFSSAVPLMQAGDKFNYVRYTVREWLEVT